MKTAATSLLLALVIAGCTGPEPVSAPGGVRAWGTLRDALRDGHTQARVDVADIASSGLVAIGAVADLDGEISIIDGTCYVSRVRDGTIQTDRSTQVKATILFGADVREWKTLEITRAVAPADFEAFVTKCAEDAGIDTAEPFPFLVEGELLAMKVHVLAGECPIRARIQGVSMTSPPVHREFEKVRGRLVGIHASGGGGVITHHGSATHVHAVLTDGEVMTGHCESVGIAEGAVLRLPAVWTGQ